MIHTHILLPGSGMHLTSRNFASGTISGLRKEKFSIERNTKRSTAVHSQPETLCLRLAPDYCNTPFSATLRTGLLSAPLQGVYHRVRAKVSLMETSFQ
jgi:hypothetical protein